MIKLKNVAHIFWVFIYCIIFLQLASSKELPLLGSFVYSLIIVFTLKIYLDYILKRLINLYLGQDAAKAFITYTFVASTLIALILTSIGYFIFRFLFPSPIFNNLAADLASMFFGMLCFTVLFSGVTFGIELLKHKIEIERQDQLLKTALLEMEMEHLRTQLSPHFTFNILNNLQFLIRKDKDEALELLARYSSILRYYVYESKNKWIKLNDEISFLKHYFHLEKDRTGENLKLNCKWNIPDNNLLIIPFVLSTFVENAFKHISTSATKDNLIDMNIYLQNEDVLIFNISNTFDRDVLTKQKEGVGLKNVKKRLELSYPENHALDVLSKDEIYQVQLQLNLSKT